MTPDPHNDLFTGMLAILVVGYFLPSIIASVRHHQSSLAITAVNIIFGLTFIGWCIALIWSLSGVHRDPVIMVANRDGVLERLPPPVAAVKSPFFQPGDGIVRPGLGRGLGLFLLFFVIAIVLALTPIFLGH